MIYEDPKCNKSNGCCVFIVLEVKGSLACLAIGQILQLWVNILKENNKDANFKWDKDG